MQPSWLTHEKILDRLVYVRRKENEKIHIEQEPVKKKKPAKKIPLMSFYVFLRILTFVLDVVSVCTLVWHSVIVCAWREMYFFD